MATPVTRIAKPQRHAFKPRTLGSHWIGPSEETCHWCGCDPRNVVHEQHEDDGPFAPGAATDEATQARLDRALDLLSQLVVLVPLDAFAWPAAQETLHGTNALLAELGRGKPDALREKAEQWAAGKEGKL